MDHKQLEHTVRQLRPSRSSPAAEMHRHMQQHWGPPGGPHFEVQLWSKELHWGSQHYLTQYNIFFGGGAGGGFINLFLKVLLRKEEKKSHALVFAHLRVKMCFYFGHGRESETSVSCSHSAFDMWWIPRRALTSHRQQLNKDVEFVVRSVLNGRQSAEPGLWGSGREWSHCEEEQKSGVFWCKNELLILHRGIFLIYLIISFIVSKCS